jgi:hypothetical protein
MYYLAATLRPIFSKSVAHVPCSVGDILQLDAQLSWALVSNCIFVE